MQKLQKLYYTPGTKKDQSQSRLQQQMKSWFYHQKKKIALNKEPKYGAVAESNFKQVLGGKIQILIGQSIGQDFFQEEIATLNCGLKISRHRIQLYDESRYLGFSGRFPARFSPMYSEIEHPRALAIQERPQQAEHEEEQVFRLDASAPL